VAGINYCICRLAFGDLTFEESKRSVELFAPRSDARPLDGSSYARRGGDLLQGSW